MKKVNLPKNICSTVGRLNQEIGTLVDEKNSLISMFLRAEHLDGNWKMVDNDTAIESVEVPPQE